ncbi:hypothetical protein B296_00032472 [Ensete ventricosum]|uniref:Pentacotripeptide-repeat region of PRORP domain-containing protein n=1 Tax=Ensete ventricosum TaxID=4639 RepID=A0A427A9Q7_ENSVE|nr:hypothetical protein B296_00032472 [Ensete ventricosum]
MLPSSLRFLAKIPSLIIQIRGFGSPFPLSKPHPLPPPPILDSEAVLEAVCINLRRRDWKFLQQFSSYLVGPLVRRVILRCRSSPRLSLDFFNWALVQQRNDERSSLDLDTYSVLIHVLVSARMFDETLRIMRQLMQERHVAALELLDALARCRKRYGGSRDVYDAMVRGCTQIGATKDACLVMETLRARGVWVSLHAYNNLLSHLLMSSQDGGVAFWEMYKEMLALGYVENVNTFNLVIYGLCRECKIGEAFSVFYRMLKGGVFPNVVTFNMLIDGCCRNGELNLAYELFKKINLVSGNNTEPNVVTFNCLINYLCKAGRAEDGEHVVKKDMLKKGLLPNVRTYGTLIDGYARKGKMEEALRLFIEMLDDGMVPNVIVYNSLLNWLLKQGHIDEACFFLSDMRKVHASHDHYTYAILVDGYCRNGCMQEAFRYYNQCREEKLVKDVVPYNSLINHLCKQGRVYEVKQLLGRMFVSCLAPDVVTYSTLIDRFFKDGKIDDALKVYDEMIEVGQRPNLITYNSIIHGFCEVECVDMARLAIEELRSSELTSVSRDVISSTHVVLQGGEVNGVARGRRLGRTLSHRVRTTNYFLLFLHRVGPFFSDVRVPLGAPRQRISSRASVPPRSCQTPEGGFSLMTGGGPTPRMFHEPSYAISCLGP